MQIPFRQGIVQCSHNLSNKPNFLQKIGNDVFINTFAGPLIVSFSQGASEYLLREPDNSSIDAFVGPFASNKSYWFYWDLNTVTGIKTYGYTTLFPIFGPTLPANPATDQHFFSTSDHKMYVWNGSNWVNKIRAFAGQLQNTQVTNEYALLGGNSVQKTFYVTGNITAEFVVGDPITIIQSGLNNGTYNVTAYVFNTPLNRTEISVSQAIPSAIIVGFLQHTPTTSLTTGQVVAYDVGTQIGDNTTILSGFPFYDQSGNAVKLINGQFFTTESPFILATGQTQPLKLEETFIFGNLTQNMAAYQIISVDSTDPTKFNPAIYEDTSQKVLGIILNNALIGQQALAALQGTVDNPNWNWAPNTTLWVDTGGVLVNQDPFIVDPVNHPVKAPPVGRAVTPTKIVFNQGLGGLGLPGPPGGSIDASVAQKGVTKLSVAPLVATNPIAVGNNDPRNSDARVPLAHIQAASTVTVSAIAPVIPASTDAQNAFNDVVNAIVGKVSKTGDTMTGNLDMGGVAKVTGLTLPALSSDAVPFGLLLSTVSNYVPLAGGTMSGPLILNGDPLVGLGAATKQYVDGLVASGITWRKPIQEPDLIGIASVVPVAPVASTTYLAFFAGPAQSWAGTPNLTVNSGDVVTWTGTKWIFVFNIFTAPPSNEFWRLGVCMEHGTPDASLTGPLAFRKNDIVQWVPGSLDPTLSASWTFPEGRANNGGGGPYISQGVTVLVDNANSLHFGHTYLYDNTNNTWIEINALGVSLSFTQLNDVPGSYSGQGGKFVQVNGGETGLQFAAGGGDVLPITQIGYGTGSGISSSGTLTYDVTSGAFTVNPGPRQFPGNTQIIGATSTQYTALTSGNLQVFFAINCTPSYLRFTFATPLVSGTEPTGLIPANTYSFDIAISGQPPIGTVSFLGSAAQTFNDLVTEINNQLSVFVFPNPVAIVAGTLIIYAVGNCGASTFVNITNNQLFQFLVAPYNVTSSVDGDLIIGMNGQFTFPGTDPTGFANDATVYSEDIVVDGITHTVSFQGQNAQTITDLVNQLSAQIPTIGVGSATVVYDNNFFLTITSNSTGPSSTVTSPQTGFFATPPIFAPPAVLAPLFSGSLTPTPGSSTLTENAPGAIFISGGNAAIAGLGADVGIQGGTSGTASGTGGLITISGGFGQNDEGGYIFLQAGNSAVSGNPSNIQIGAGHATGDGGQLNLRTGVAIGLGVNGDMVFDVPAGTTRLTIKGSTGEWQLAGDPGLAGYALSSNGAGSPPTWQPVAVSLSSLTAAVAGNNISNSNFQQVWGWQLTADGQVGFKVLENLPSTNGTFGSQALFRVETQSGSTANPFIVYSGSTGLFASPIFNILVANDGSVNLHGNSASTGSGGSGSNMTMFAGSADSGITGAGNTGGIINIRTGDSNLAPTGAASRLSLIAGNDPTPGTANINGYGGQVFLTAGSGTNAGSVFIESGVPLDPSGPYSISPGIRQASIVMVAPIISQSFPDNEVSGRSDYVLYASTVDASPTEMGFTLSGLPGLNGRMNMSAEEAWIFDIRVVALNIVTGDSAAYQSQGLIKDHIGTVSFVGAPVTSTIANDVALGTASISVNADNVNKALGIVVTGVAATQLKWSATAKITRVHS